MMKRAQRGKTRAQRAKKSGLGSAIPVGFHHLYSIFISIHLRITPPKTKSRAARGVNNQAAREIKFASRCQ